MGEPGEFDIIALEGLQRDHGDEQRFEYAGIEWFYDWRSGQTPDSPLKVSWNADEVDLSKSTRFR